MTARRVGVVVLALFVLTSYGLPAGADATRPSPPSAAPVETDAGTVQAFDGQANNSTRHENPEAVDEEGSLAAVEAWLAGRMGGRLERSSVQLSRGEYERADSLVGEEYRDLLGKYVDVAGETRERDDDRASDRFRAAGDTQETFVSQVRRYRETHERYREARAAGDEARARELARDLAEQADAIDRTGERLQGQYANVSNASDVDMTAGSEAVASVRTNVSEQQAAVREETFVETRLSVTTDAETVSFTDPLVASGRLLAANGTPIADRRVRLRVGNRRISARTDAEGRFSVTYRPTTAPVGTGNVSVRYAPAGGSVYLGSTDHVPVTVEQVRPRVELAGQFETVAFDDDVVVNGSVAAGGVGAADVPVVVSLGDERLGTATTGADGSFTFEGRVPAAVEAGERTISVQVPLDDRALASANASAPVTVTTTVTRLAVAESRFASGGVRVAGRLVTADGVAVPDRRLAVTLDGTTLGTVRTGENGTFAATLAVPGRVRPASGATSRELVVAFDGAGTNLEPSRAAGSVRVPAATATGERGSAANGPDGTGPDGIGPDGIGPGANGPDGSLLSLSWLGALLGTVVLVVGAVALWRRRAAGSERSDRSGAGAGGDASPERASRARTLFDAAARRLDDGETDAAVEAAYTAVRREVEATLGVASARTHWEFLRASRAAGLDDDAYGTLEALTERYERAAFAPDPVASHDAEAVVDAARSVEIAGPSGD